jgi:hypothetical protein
MLSKMSDIPEHRDKLGRLLKLGDCVAYPTHNSLSIGTIKKLNPKMVKVAKIGTKHKDNGSNKYPQDIVLLDGPDVVFYLLKMNTSG